MVKSEAGLGALKLLLDSFYCLTTGFPPEAQKLCKSSSIAGFLVTDRCAHLEMPEA